MMTRRIERVNELLRAEISELVQRHLKDPRLGSLVSVTEVVTSPDLRHAKVFISVLGTPEERAEAVKGLEAAAGFLRHELASRLDLRHIPVLSFREDASIERGARVLQLLKEVSEEPRED